MEYIPDNITDCLFSAKIEIEKARLLTDYLSQDYPFDKKPEPWLLMHDYKRLAIFIDVACDCMRYSSKFIEQAIKLDKGGVAND